MSSTSTSATNWRASRNPSRAGSTPLPGRSGDPRRPEQLRVIPNADTDALRLYGLRSEAEGFRSNYKRTLIVDRAKSLGWRRDVVDLYCFALYNDALTEDRHASLTTERASPTCRRTPRASTALA